MFEPVDKLDMSTMAEVESAMAHAGIPFQADFVLKTLDNIEDPLMTAGMIFFFGPDAGVSHPYILSREAIEGLIEGLQEILPQVTYSNAVKKHARKPAGTGAAN